MEAKFEQPTEKLDEQEKITSLRDISDAVRYTAFQTILEADSGHLGGVSSSTELMVSLYFGGYLDYDPLDSKNPFRDLVLVRGHEGPLRYAIFSMIGYLDEDELHHYREYGSRLHGHEDMDVTPGVDITPSGSLGMLLSYGVGAAVEAKASGNENKVVVFLGDGEEQEGNVGEAARYAGNLSLDNLVVVIDKNKKQLSGANVDVDGHTDLHKLWEACGWEVVELTDGHNLEEICAAYDYVFKQPRSHPVAIIANTIKGYKLPNVESNYSGAHTIGAYGDNEAVGVAIGDIKAEIESRGVTKDSVIEVARTSMPKANTGTNLVEPIETVFHLDITPSQNTSIVRSHSEYYAGLADVLETLPYRPQFYFLTPDLLKKPLVAELGLSRLGLFYDVGIREQHAIAMAHGISVMNRDARITLFMGDAFVYRSLDQLNVASQGGSKMLILAEKAGLCQSTNGSSHQSVGQPLAIVGIPGVDFKEPADVEDFFGVLNWYYSNNERIAYFRLHNKKFKDGDLIPKDIKRSLDYYVVYEPSKTPDLSIASAGFPLLNSIQAAQALLKEYDVSARVINIVDPKSLGNDFADLIPESKPLLVFYNGNPDTLSMPISKALLAYDTAKRPKSIKAYGYNKGTTGSLSDLERHFGLDKTSIVNQAIESIY